MIWGGATPRWEQVAGESFLSLEAEARSEVWVEVSLSYGRWRTRWSEGPYPPGTTVLAPLVVPAGIDYPPGLFRQPAVVVANVSFDGRNHVSAALPVLLQQTEQGVRVRRVPRAFDRPMERRAVRTAQGIRRVTDTYNPARRVRVADEHLVRVIDGYVRPVAQQDPDTFVAPIVPDAELVVEPAGDGLHRREVR